MGNILSATHNSIDFTHRLIKITHRSSKKMSSFCEATGKLVGAKHGLKAALFCRITNEAALRVLQPCY